MILVDTSGWIAHFRDEAKAPRFAAALARPGELLVPTICLYEVYKKLRPALGRRLTLEAVVSMRQGQVVDLDADLSLRAARISLTHKLPMADSVIYATARLNRAELWTMDGHFKGLPGVRFLE